MPRRANSIAWHVSAQPLCSFDCLARPFLTREGVSEGSRARSEETGRACASGGAGRSVFIAAGKAQDPEYFPMPAGQSAGMIHDLPRAGDVVRALDIEAEETLRRMQPA
jgi:hypothetical protein